MILHFDGFDFHTYERLVDKYIVEGTFHQGLTQAGRYDGNSMAIFNTAFDRIQYSAYVSDQTEVFSTFNFKPIHTTGGLTLGNSEFYTLRTFVDPGPATRKLAFAIRSNGKLQVFREGAGGNFAGTMIFESGTTPVFTLNEWCQLEIRAKFPTGLWIRKNGIPILEDPALITSTTPGHFVNYAGPCWESFGFNGFCIDDWSVHNTVAPGPVDYLGPTRVVTVLARADRLENAWSPSSGLLHYNLLRENTGTYWDTTTYLTAVLGLPRSEYFLHDLFYSAGVNLALKHNMVMMNPSGGTSKIRALGYIGPIYESPDIDTVGGTTYKNYTYLQQFDPDNGLAWSDSRLENWRFGFKYQSGQDVRCTKFAMEKLIQLADNIGARYRTKGRFR